MPEIRIDSWFSRELRLLLSREIVEVLISDKSDPFRSAGRRSRIERSACTAGDKIAPGCRDLQEYVIASGNGLFVV